VIKVNDLKSTVFNSTLKNTKDTLKCENSRTSKIKNEPNIKAKEQSYNQEDNSISNSSRDISLMPQEDDTENITALSNSSDNSTGIFII
jgi:hypothetical protein